MAARRGDIRTVKGREALPVDPNDTIFSKVTVGQYVGFRKTGRPCAGTWWARYRDANTGKRSYHRLGDFATEPQSKQYDLALAAAQKWLKHMAAGGSDEVETVADACKAYIQSIPDGAKAKRTRADLTRSVMGTSLATVNLIDLKPRHVEDWRKEISKRPVRVGRGGALREGRERSPASVNRELVPLRAALNRAYRRGQIPSNLAWRETLKPATGDGTGNRREAILSKGERAKLLESAGSEIKPFLMLLGMLPLRPGAVAALSVANWDRRASVLTIPKDKANSGRKFRVTPAVATFLDEQCRRKLPATPIFTDGQGARWNKDTWKKAVRIAVKTAGLPAEVTAYTLRHSLLTELVEGGAPLSVAARIAGTSVEMLTKVYHHLTDEAAESALAVLG